MSTWQRFCLRLIEGTPHGDFLGISRATSRNVAGRLERYNGVDALPLYHPPPFAEQYCCAPAEDYSFFPSRMCYLKRPELVLAALALTSKISVSIVSRNRSGGTCGNDPAIHRWGCGAHND